MPTERAGERGDLVAFLWALCVLLGYFLRTGVLYLRALRDFARLLLP